MGFLLFLSLGDCSGFCEALIYPCPGLRIAYVFVDVCLGCWGPIFWFDSEVEIGTLGIPVSLPAYAGTWIEDWGDHVVGGN